MINVITYGTFDTLHYGHIRLLNRAKLFGDKLYVGVSTDKMCVLKGKTPFLSLEERISLVSSIRSVDEVFPEEDMSQKVKDAEKLHIDVFVLGDDYKDSFRKMEEYEKLLALGVQIVFLPRTPSISSTIIRKGLK